MGMNNPFSPISWASDDSVDTWLVGPRQVSCKPAASGGCPSGLLKICRRSISAPVSFMPVPGSHNCWQFCNGGVRWIIGGTNLPVFWSTRCRSWRGVGVVSPKDPLLPFYALVSLNVSFPLLPGFSWRRRWFPINIVCRFSVPVCISPIYFVPWPGKISQRDFKGAACYSVIWCCHGAFDRSPFTSYAQFSSIVLVEWIRCSLRHFQYPFRLVGTPYSTSHLYTPTKYTALPCFREYFASTTMPTPPKIIPEFLAFRIIVWIHFPSQSQ